MWEGLLSGPLPLCLRDSNLAVRSVALDVMATVGDDTLKQLNVRNLKHSFQPLNLCHYPSYTLIDISKLVCLMTVCFSKYTSFKPSSSCTSVLWPLVVTQVQPGLLFSQQNHYNIYWHDQQS